MNERLPNGRFLKIDELYAFIAIDENGNEGIMSMFDGTTHIPLIGADTARLDSIRPLADEVTRVSGIKYEIRYFKRAYD